MVNSALFLTNFFKIYKHRISLEDISQSWFIFIVAVCLCFFMCGCVVLYLFLDALFEVAVNVLSNFCSSPDGKLLYPEIK